MSDKVKFKRRKWKSIVKAADPKPTRDAEYVFSNGRTFYSRRPS